MKNRPLAPFARVLDWFANRHAARGALALSLVVAASSASAQLCGSLENAYGPYDYRTAEGARALVIVEKFHFTPDVETLRRGASGTIAGDLDYTLRAAPNHARALRTMMMLVEREKRDRPPGAGFSMECYFDRAQRFAPDDGAVRVLYAVYLRRLGKMTEAKEQASAAAELAPNDPNVQYNLGLVYFDLKDMTKSLEHARKAYELGFPLPGLRNKLQAAGAWRD